MIVDISMFFFLPRLAGKYDKSVTWTVYFFHRETYADGIAGFPVKRMYTAMQNVRDYTNSIHTPLPYRSFACISVLFGALFVSFFLCIFIVIMNNSYISCPQSEIYPTTETRRNILDRTLRLLAHKYLKKDCGFGGPALAAKDIASAWSAVAVSIAAAESPTAGEVPTPSSCLPFAAGASAEINSAAIVPATAASPAPVASCWVPRADVDAETNAARRFANIRYVCIDCRLNWQSRMMNTIHQGSLEKSIFRVNVVDYGDSSI